MKEFRSILKLVLTLIITFTFIIINVILVKGVSSGLVLHQLQIVSVLLVVCLTAIAFFVMVVNKIKS